MSDVLDTATPNVRTLVITILKSAPSNTLSLQELLDQVRHYSPNVSDSVFSQTIRRLREFENIVQEDDTVLLVSDTDNRKNQARSGVRKKKVRVQFETTPRRPPSVVSSNPVGQRKEISPFFQQAEGRTVLVSRPEEAVEDVIQMSIIYINGTEMNVPMPDGDVKIRLGAIPEWSPRQVTNRNVAMIRFVRHNGEIIEMNVNPNEDVTIDRD